MRRASTASTTRGRAFSRRLELRLGRRRPLLLSSTHQRRQHGARGRSHQPRRGQGRQAVGAAGGPAPVSHAPAVGWPVPRAHPPRQPRAPPDRAAADARLRCGLRRSLRGARHRERRGAVASLRQSSRTSGALLRYDGLDGVERRTRLEWSRSPTGVEDRGVTFSVSLEPREVVEVELTVACELGAASRPSKRYDASLASLKGEMAARQARECGVVSSNESFNRWLRRSSADLRMMMTDTPSGPYPYAGDSLVQHALRPRRPHHGARDAVGRPRAGPRRARVPRRDPGRPTVSEAQDAQPGKILHEMRAGEMAALGEIPFGRYYGSVDATPLFVMLARRLLRAHRRPRASSSGCGRTCCAALHWMDDVRRRGRRRVRRVRAAAASRGSSSRGGRTRTTRSSTRTATLAEPPDRALRGPGVRLRRVGRRGRRSPRAAATSLGPRQLARPGRARCASGSSEAFWCEDARHLRAGARRREAPVPRADVERRPLPVHRHRRAGARAARRRDADGATRRSPAGASAPSPPASALQPDVLPQRLGVAARQRADRGGLRALRVHAARRAPGRRDVRPEPVGRPPPPARAHLRLPPPRRRAPDALPGGVRARRPGPPARSTSCCRRAWGCVSMPPSAGCRCTVRCCPRASSGCAWPTW